MELPLHSEMILFSAEVYSVTAVGFYEGGCIMRKGVCNNDVACQDARPIKL